MRQLRPHAPTLIPPAGAPGSLFVSSAWFDLLKAHGMDASEVRDDVAVEADGRKIVLPLLRQGSRFKALANYYSADYGAMDGVELSGQAAQQLAAVLRARASRIELRPLKSDAALLTILQQALRGSGFACDTFHVTTNWHLPCENLRWSDYLASRPSRLSNTLRRCRKRLEAQDGFRIEIVTSVHELPSALAAYERVYAASWKSPEPHARFMPELCRMAATAGWLRLGVLWLGGEAAAAQVWFVKDGAASIYKLAYDARFAKLGVGTVLTAALTEHVLEEDRVREIDFLTGDDSYKAEWMSHRREMLGLIAFNTATPSGLLGAITHFGGRSLRRLLRDYRKNGAHA